MGLAVAAARQATLQPSQSHQQKEAVEAVELVVQLQTPQGSVALVCR